MSRGYTLDFIIEWYSSSLMFYRQRCHTELRLEEEVVTDVYTEESHATGTAGTAAAWV